MRKIWSAHHNMYMPLGGRLISATRPRLKFGNYVTDASALPTPPGAVDYGSTAAASLGRMYCNDRLGCCVVAALAHLRGVSSANAGGPEVQFTDDQIIALYGLMGGYIPGRADTDEGCDENTAIGVAMSQGFPDGVKLAATMSVDATNWNEVKLALWLFEGLMTGQGLPEAWVSPAFPAPDAVLDLNGPSVPTNGHAMAHVGYPDDTKLDTRTWGMRVWETRRALATYAAPGSQGELHASLSPDVISRASQKAPNGFDFATLLVDISALSAQPPSVSSTPTLP